MTKRAQGQAPSEYQAAFAQAYEAFYTRVFAYIFNRVGGVEVAKDLTAEVFEKAFTKGHGLRRPEAYTAWLFTIARNTVAGYYRRRKRSQHYQEQIKELLLRQGSTEELPERVIQNETMSELMTLMRRLSPREQELLALKFDGELTNAEIASVMGMSAVNVRVSLFRALARLRQLIEGAGGWPSDAKELGQ